VRIESDLPNGGGFGNAWGASFNPIIFMKKLLLFAIVSLGVCAFAGDKPAKSALAAADKVVWAGVDYSHARLIGPGEFANPEAIFPGMLEAWNGLVLQERLGFLEKELHKPVVADIAGVTKANQSASASQIINSPGANDTVRASHITPEVIARAVRSYKMENKSGVAVVFIVDRLVKLGKKGEGAVYVVAFDIGTREVLSSERIIGKAVGFGFRNFWFRVVKDAEKGLGKIR
jgi:hypothetical protein